MVGNQKKENLTLENEKESLVMIMEPQSSKKTYTVIPTLISSGKQILVLTKSLKRTMMEIVLSTVAFWELANWLSVIR